MSLREQGERMNMGKQGKTESSITLSVEVCETVDVLCEVSQTV